MHGLGILHVGKELKLYVEWGLASICHERADSLNTIQLSRLTSFPHDTVTLILSPQ